MTNKQQKSAYYILKDELLIKSGTTDKEIVKSTYWNGVLIEK